MLTSTKNPTIQKIRRLQSRARERREAGLFVIEGKRLVEECLSAATAPATLLHIPGAAPELVEGARELGAKVIEVSEHVMRAASDTKTPQGVLAVVPIPAFPLPERPTFLLVLDGLRDPGNLGTILRTAAAAGVEGVLLAPGSADPFAPKVVRAGMGAHFRLPIRPAGWDEIEARARGLKVFLAAAGGEIAYTDAGLAAPLALVIGSEAHGAGDEVGRLQPLGLRIPMPGGSESLNAAVAAGVVLFEIVRQRG